MPKCWNIDAPSGAAEAVSSLFEMKNRHFKSVFNVVNVTEDVLVQLKILSLLIMLSSLTRKVCFETLQNYINFKLSQLQVCFSTAGGHRNSPRNVKID